MGAGPTELPANGPRAQTLKSGRSRAELLGAAITQTRKLLAPGALEHACTTQVMAPSLQQAYTTKAETGLVAIELKSGKIGHQSPSSEDQLDTDGGARQHPGFTGV